MAGLPATVRRTVTRESGLTPSPWKVRPLSGGHVSLRWGDEDGEMPPFGSYPITPTDLRWRSRCAPAVGKRKHPCARL